MIISIMIYTDSGLLAYEARFERCEINCDLVAGFATAVRQFGSEIFPRDQLADILFTNTHMVIEQHEVNGNEITFLVIHEPFEDHDFIYRLIEVIRDELEEKYSNVFKGPGINRSKLAKLDDFIYKIFKDAGREESPFTCTFDDY